MFRILIVNSNGGKCYNYITFPPRKSKAGDSTVAEIRAARYIGPERVSIDSLPRACAAHSRDRLICVCVNTKMSYLSELDTFMDCFNC